MSDDSASEMESHESEKTAPVEPATHTKRRKRLVPPIWVWLILIATIAMIAVVRTRDPAGDHAIVNILTLILSFLGFCCFSFWFLFFSGYSGKFRVGCCVGVVSSVALFFTAFRIGHVSGELIPTFRSRWAHPVDALLKTPAQVASGKKVDLATPSDQDFPQFLGPNRDGTIRTVRLAKNWDSNLPEQLWRHSIGAGWSGFVAVNGYAVTMEQRGDDELVTCYDVRTGELMWAHTEANRHHTILGGTGPRSTPTIHEGNVYTLGPSGSLLCLQGATGEVLWRDDLLSRYNVPPGEDSKNVAWGRSNSPLIVDDLVVVPVGGHGGGPYVTLAAFDRLTGELAWEGGDQQVSFASPTVTRLGDQRVIVIVNESSVSGHDPTSGAELFQVPWSGSSTGNANVSQASLIGDRLLLSKGYSTGASLWQLTTAENGKISTSEIWAKKSVLKTKFSNHIVAQDYAYGLSDGIAECIEIETGRKQWKKGRYGHGQMLLVDDVLLIQAESGEVVLVEATPARFNELTKFEAIEGKTWNNPCLYGNLLLVRNAEEAACYRLPIEE